MFVLFVEHNPERQRVVGEALDAAGHRVERVSTGSEAVIRLAGPGGPDLVLAEDRLPDMRVDEFLQALGRMDVGCHIVVYGKERGAEAWIEATSLGLLDYVRIDEEASWLVTLEERLERAARRAGEEQRAHRLAAALDSTAAAVLLIDRASCVRYANEAGRRLLNRTPGSVEGVELHEIVRFGDDSRARSDVFRALETDGEWAGEVDVLRPDGEHVPALGDALAHSPCRTRRLAGLRVDVARRVRSGRDGGSPTRGEPAIGGAGGPRSAHQSLQPSLLP